MFSATVPENSSTSCGRVADVFAETAARPAGDVGPVKTDGAGIRRPDAKQQTQQR